MNIGRSLKELQREYKTTRAKALRWLSLSCLRLCLRYVWPRLSESGFRFMPWTMEEAGHARDRLKAMHMVKRDPVLLDAVLCMNWLIGRLESRDQPVRWIEAEPDVGLFELERGGSQASH